MKQEDALFDGARLAAEHKERIRRTRIEQLIAIDPLCPTDAIMALFAFDLPDREADAASHAPQVDGLAVVFTDHLAIYQNGSLMRSYSFAPK